MPHKYHVTCRLPRSKYKLELNAPSEEHAVELARVMGQEGATDIECFTYESVDRRIEIEF